MEGLQKPFANAQRDRIENDQSNSNDVYPKGENKDKSAWDEHNSTDVIQNVTMKNEGYNEEEIMDW